jgi:hypothetical protein
MPYGVFPTIDSGQSIWSDQLPGLPDSYEIARKAIEAQRAEM